jgi:hypothetical protein
MRRPPPSGYTFSTQSNSTLSLVKEHLQTMADSSKTDLLTLVKQLEEQVNVITTYLGQEKLPEPSFIPSPDSLKPSMSSLPPAIEEARKKAYSLSWGLNTLLATPDNHLMSTALQVSSLLNSVR